jgi:hypothetical protein
MTKEISKEIWVLRDQYIDKRIEGEEIDIEVFCDMSGLDENDRNELHEILLEYEASQKALQKLLSKNVDSDRIWNKLQKRLSDEKILRLRQPDRYKTVIGLAAEDDKGKKELESRLKLEFSQKTISFSDYSARLSYEDENTALLVFRKGYTITPELDGCLVEIQVKDGKSQLIQIKDGFVAIHFSELEIAIGEYDKINYVIRCEDKIIAKGSLDNE